MAKRDLELVEEVPMKQQLKSLYIRAFSALPPAVRKAALHLDFAAGHRNVYFDPVRHPSRRLRCGTVTLSLDFEMAWAWQYSKRESHRAVEMGLHERAQVPRLLAIFEEFGTPATWATVGHLFLDKCNRGAQGRAHPDMPRLNHFETRWWRFSQGDWYQFDPCSDVKRNPAWYAPDLVERLVNSRVKHEVACHSFSHAGFGTFCPEEVAAAELDACAEVMAKYGLKTSTLVFPGNIEGNYPVLARKGVRVVRAFPVPKAHISLPLQRTDGIWAVHVSAAIDSWEDWNVDQQVHRMKRIVDTAGKTRLSAHIWMHPSLSTKQMETVLVPFLRYCAEQRERGLIEVLTMEQLAAATREAHGSSEIAGNVSV